MEDHNKLKCSYCGTVLEFHISFDGCDFSCEAGEGSGFDRPISLECPRPGCGHVYPVGRIRREADFSRELEILRPYNTPGTHARRAKEKAPWDAVTSQGAGACAPGKQINYTTDRDYLARGGFS